VINWFDLSESDRVSQVYSKTSIKQFWDWWSDGGSVMEVRIMDVNLIKFVAKQVGIPWSFSGVYVSNDVELKKVIGLVRDKATVWFGIQPRKKNWSKVGFKVFEGKDTHVESLKYLFIDVDRVVKEAPASCDELHNTDILANHILDRLGEQGWNKSYMKICSGNGVQILVKLDFPIKLPEVVYDDEHNGFISNGDFEDHKKLISHGIGMQLNKFCKQFKDDLGVELDTSVFKLSGVGALPVTKNIKYNTFRWRGVIEVKDGENTGLTDYILSVKEDIKKYRENKVFKTGGVIITKHRLREGRLEQNDLIKFMLNTDFPNGGINNTLWFQLKVLLRDSKIDLGGDEFMSIYSRLKLKHNRTFTLNLPSDEFDFDENIVNRFCIDNLIPPLYKLWPTKIKYVNMELKTLSWGSHLFFKEVMSLPSDTDLLVDLKFCKDQLVVGDYNNVVRVSYFVNGLIEKYGEEKAKYYFNYLFERFFNYD